MTRLGTEEARELRSDCLAKIQTCRTGEQLWLDKVELYAIVKFQGGSCPQMLTLAILV